MGTLVVVLDQKRQDAVDTRFDLFVPAARAVHVCYFSGFVTLAVWALDVFDSVFDQVWVAAGQNSHCLKIIICVDLHFHTAQCVCSKGICGYAVLVFQEYAHVLAFQFCLDDDCLCWVGKCCDGFESRHAYQQKL